MVNEAWHLPIELSPQDRGLLEGIRGEFKSLLCDYIDDIPEDVVSGPCIFKCQNGWFSMMSGRLSMASKNIPQSVQTDQLSRSLERATRFINAYAHRSVITRKKGELYLATPQNIKSANIVIENVIQEIDNILSQ